MNTQHYIAGRWQPAQDERCFEVRNPADDSLIAQVSEGSSADARLAADAAALALPALTLKKRGGAPLATLHHALAAQPVALSVELCSTELTLGYLRTLAVGDVLALPVGLEQAMRVTGPGDTTVCHAHLGALSGFHAVELMKPAP